MPLRAALSAAASGLFGSMSQPVQSAQPSMSAPMPSMPLPQPRVEGPRALELQALEEFEAHPRRRVPARAEGEAGVELEHAAGIALRLRLPLGQDEQALAHGYGLIILLPVVLPVLIRHRARLGLNAERLGPAREPLAAGGAVLDVDLDARDAGVAALELGVDVVPILAVFPRGSGGNPPRPQ